VEAITVIVSCVLSALLSALIGKRYAEEFADLIRGMGVVILLAGLISTIVSFIGVFTWIAPAVSSADQCVQFVYNIAHTLLAFVLNWLQDSLASIPLGILSYIVTYLATLATRVEETYYYFSLF